MTEQSVAHRARRSSSVRRFACVASVLVVLGVVAGCSENPAPEPLEPDTSAASTSASPSATPSGAPTLPPEARGTSDKAAIAFVEHVIDVLNYSAKTLDPSGLRSVVMPSCDACESIRATVQSIRSNGGSIKGGAWTPVETNVLAGGSKGFVQIQVVVDCAAQTVERANGDQPIRHPGGRRVFIFDLRGGAAGWKVAAIRGGGS